MKNLSCFLLAFGLTLFASAQKVYFIYLQTEENFVFYAKMNDKIFSSSQSGYLILPNLHDSTYNFSIGFPSSQKESKFSVTIAGKDRGFLTKNFEDGLGLFDLQTLNVIRAKREETDNTISYQRRNDGFSSLLSRAANDTSLLYAVVRQQVPVQKQEEVVAMETKTNVDLTDIKNDQIKLLKDTITDGQRGDIAIIANVPASDSSKSLVDTQAVSFLSNNATKNEDNNRADSLINIQSAESNKEANKDSEITLTDSVKGTNIDTETFRRSSVKRHAESSTLEGFGLVFFDNYENGVDTIRLIIPNPRIAFKQGETDSSDRRNEFIQVSELHQDTVVQLPIVVSNKIKVMQKSNCKATAANNDFFKLRKNMAAKETDEGMVEEAKKFFRTKCFTTEQIKNLSALFLTSSGKYQFFDAAYLHVTDQDRFPSLESEIKDEYYFKRFKALVGE